MRRVNCLTPCAWGKVRTSSGPVLELGPSVPPFNHSCNVSGCAGLGVVICFALCVSIARVLSSYSYVVWWMYSSDV